MSRMKKANKKATRGKGKVLKKGQSSSSNPECNKHRLAAKKRAYFGNQGNSNLTVAQLNQHDKLSNENELEGNDDAMSIGFGTALTGFTNCSLPTFSRLIKNWNSNSFLHKEMLAVLEAVADVIKSSGEEETEAKYVSALITLLDAVETDETLTAVICLVSMVVRKMEKAALVRLQEKNVLEIFSKLLIKYMNTDHCALLRNLLSIVFSFLKARTKWSEKGEELRIILELTTHHKPKVRKLAHIIIRSILANHVPENSTTHPLAPFVANFCGEKLQSYSSNTKETFYTLALLHEILGLFPILHIKKTCETIIKILTLSEAMLTSSCLKALQGLFCSKSAETLDAELNAKIISAMYLSQPNIKETQCLLEWMKFMESALISLNKLNKKLCISHLPAYFSNAVKCWLSDREEIMAAVAITLNNLLHACIDPNHEAFQSFLFDDPINNPMHKMFHHVEGALSYQYHRAWKYVIFVIAGFFETMGKPCHTVMMKCLQSLADLHDSFKFPHKHEVEKALGVAIENIGPRIVLTAIPLQIGVERPDFPRSWMLPLLRDHIKKTELDFFIKYFLPLAKKMKDRALILNQEGRIVEGKLIEVLYTQIWSLLPGFCTDPIDLDKSFVVGETTKKGLPRILAEVLKSEPPLRLIVLSAVRLLITKNLDNETHVETMVRFSENYLPVLFNLYSPDSEGEVEENVRRATYETIKTYLQITKKEVVESFFNKVIEKLPTVESNIFKQTALVDIAKAILPYLDETHITQLYNYCTPLLTHSNHTLQKKAFGVIKDIFGGSSEGFTNFVKSNWNNLCTVLMAPVSNLPPATKALRLDCLKCMVSQLKRSEFHLMKQLIPEAVLLTKENSVKARLAALNLVVEMAHCFRRLLPNEDGGATRQYLTLLLAGLTGNAHMMSASVICIGRVMYEFKDELEFDMIHLLIQNVCVLLTSKTREVVTSAMSFMKILFAVVDTTTLAQHIEFLVKSITSIAQDHQRHFRFKAKEILTRLIRKFGYEMISKLAPEQHQKQLSNIRKLEARKQRKKSLKGIESDSDDNPFDEKSNEYDALLDDSDEEVNEVEPIVNKMKLPRKKKMKGSYLEEHNENDIIDFMDPSAGRRLTSQPSKESSSAIKSENIFPIAEDGRIIIEDKDDNSQQKKKKNKDVPSFEELVNNKKRKLDDSDDEEIEPETKPQEVKKGIHRTLEPKTKKKRPGEQFKTKKAGGDVKKGKLEPYAYVPFDRQALNKRKKVKLKGQFNNIVKAAKKGAVVGLKRKARESKKKKNF